MIDCGYVEMKLEMLVRNRVKMLLAGSTDGAAGKFDSTTLVVVLLFVDV